jgi:hypothetical protein
MITLSARTSCSHLGNPLVHLINTRALLHAHCGLAFHYSRPTVSHETRGSTGALPSTEARIEATERVVAPEPSLPGG